MKKFTPILILLFILSGCNNNQNQLKDNKFIVEFEENGYIKNTSVNQVKKEHLRIKAISAYEYALPIVAMEEWHKNFLKEAKHSDWLIYDNQASKKPILTANTTTPYVISFVNLKESSYYIEIPKGPIGGLVVDIYQSPVSDLGVLGPDQGKGGKYLLVGPESDTPKNNDADYIIKSNSNLVLIGTRIIGLSGDDYLKSLNAHRLYKIDGKASNQKFINATTDANWMGNQPHGIEYWENLNNVLQNEPVVDRNRFILTQLRGTGIEKNKAFTTSNLQKEVLIEAEKTGNAIAMVTTFSRESYKEKHWKDRNWLYVLNMKYLDQIHPHYYEVQEIASYSYEAITTSKAMVLNNVGKGSKYLGAYMDADKNWLDGKNTYEILVPKNAPANQFWSITAYDNDTRCIIQNKEGKSDISSIMKNLKIEENGDVKVYVSPKAPVGYENNWIPSNPEKGFFVYLRLYGPLEGYFDKTWKMADVKKIN